MTVHPGLPRQLQLEGSRNFRDLGGYLCAGGRRVRPGLLFRSDQLSQLSAADLQVIRDLGIRTVVDLRRAAERAAQPDRLDDTGIDQVWLPVDAQGTDLRGLLEQLHNGTMDAADARRHLIEANRQFAADFSGQYRQLLALLAQAERYPLVFHCTGGKDRAGFAAAVVLLALGADRATVFHDYLATNTCTAALHAEVMAALPTMTEIRATPDTISTLLRVEPDYLETALTTAETLHGSLDNYLDRALGLTPARRSRLRALLLEPAPGAAPSCGST